MSPPSEQVTPPLEELAGHVRPLLAPEFDGMNRLGDVLASVADATVLGIGEPGHGIRDCHRLQHRLCKQLVREHGLRVVALEAHASEVRALDEYVVRGIGSAEEAMRELSFWVWQTEAYREFLEWLRAFNADRPVSDRVRVHGIDVQSTSAPAERVASYLEAVDPGFRDATGDALELLGEGIQPHTRDDDPDETRTRSHVETAGETVATLADRFDDRREAYIDATDERAFELARRHVKVLEYAVDLARVALEDGHGVTYGGRRDGAMVESVEWLLEFEPHDSIAVVAANGHLRTGNDHHEDADPQHGPLGYHLDRAFGDDYRVLAVEFGTGSVRMLDADSEAQARSFPAQQLDSPPADSLPAALTALTDDTAFVDLAAASEDPAVAEWLANADSHGFAPLYDDDRDAGLAGNWGLDYSREADGLLFVPEVDAAELLDFVTEPDG
ncbi:erythromycin esterase family protein [Halorubellus salinus]|uniref:erythromycin esterase family protein n=1 Tax=Halorubellus salinus TaxID=755309 RepID=UPI001D05F061|nr:erythromycin esterase family protein [Halorubellus salinus]